MGKWGTGKILKNCLVCNNNFLARIDKPGFFCSRNCQRLGRIKKPKTIITFICKNCDLTVKRQKNKNSTYEFCSIKCMAQKRGKKFSKENHPNWKGGISERTYKSKKTIEKAKKIKKKCNRCGQDENLHGHHIIKYSERLDLCDNLNNIEILCRDCHIKEHPNYKNLLLSIPVRKGIIKECIICYKKFYVQPYKINTAKYCTNDCRYKGLKKKENKHD